MQVNLNDSIFLDYESCDSKPVEQNVGIQVALDSLSQANDLPNVGLENRSIVVRNNMRPLTDADYIQSGPYEPPFWLNLSCAVAFWCGGCSLVALFFTQVPAITRLPCTKNENCDIYEHPEIIVFFSAIGVLAATLVCGVINITLRVLKTKVRAHREWRENGRIGPAPV